MYIRISQTILSQMKTYNIETLDKVLETVLVRDVYVKHFETPQKATWGTAVYRIETDGNLTMIDSYWDTSD